jgi:DNA-binding transcriptional LysR family regulator
MNKPLSTSTYNLAFDPDRLGLIAAFVAVADKLSFAEAGDILNLTASTISRKVLRLEKTLGVRLFNRTTRKVALTEAGRLYHGQCRNILDSLNEADAMVTSLNHEARGLLRISLPVAFGRLHMPAVFGAYLERHSKVSLDACYSDRFVDLISEDFDLSIRIGMLPDSSLIARNVAVNHRILVASPAYIERFGVPTTPADLAHHECIRYNLYKSSGNVWRFRRGAEEESVSVSGHFRCDNSEVVADIAQRGLGIALVARYICHDQILSGTLVPLLQDWQTIPESNVYLCYSSARFLSPKVRSFVDFMLEWFRDVEWAKATT